MDQAVTNTATQRSTSMTALMLAIAFAATFFAGAAQTGHGSHVRVAPAACFGISMDPNGGCGE
jgi:hypothetical protein